MGAVRLEPCAYQDIWSALELQGRGNAVLDRAASILPSLFPCMKSNQMTISWHVQSAKAALAAALENAEGVREAVAAKEVLEAAQKSSTAAWRSHSVSPLPSYNFPSYH